MPHVDDPAHGCQAGLLAGRVCTCRSLATTDMSKINALYRSVKPGAPVTSADLAALGVSADLAVHYVRAGWLTRLARGVFARPDMPLDLHASLRLLEHRVEGLHVGGKSALEWHGVRHNVPHRPQLQLYGWASGPVPPWFTTRCPSSYRRLRLFDEQPNKPLRVSHRADRVLHGVRGKSAAKTRPTWPRTSVPTTPTVSWARPHGREERGSGSTSGGTGTSSACSRRR